MKQVKNYLIWVAMWACDIIPWVSWWTIAFITGVYEKLISSIRACMDMDSVRQVFAWDRKALWTRINWGFLLTIFGWIVTSIFVLSHFLESVLEQYPHLVWWLFAWLVLASIYFLIISQEHRSSKELLSLFCGWVVAFWITQLTPAQVEPQRRIIIVSAMIAISAMILPGISWSFLLLIMWMYGHTISAINDFNIWFLLLFVLWVVLWLWGFVRVVDYVYKEYRSITVAVLIGFMIWALPKLRPWQNNITQVDEYSWEEFVLSTKHVQAGDYNSDPNLIFVLLLFLLWSCWSVLFFKSFEQN